MLESSCLRKKCVEKDIKEYWRRYTASKETKKL